MITIANHPTAVTNCRVAETIEKRHNLLSHGEMLENVRPRSIIGKYLPRDTSNTAPLLTSWLRDFGRAPS